MDSMWSIMDLIFAGCGVYAIYNVYLMKTTGEIKKTLLMSSEVDLKKCKDIEAYKAFILPKLLIFGIGTLLYGASGLINTYVVPLGIVYKILMVLFFVVLVWFAAQSRKGMKNFW